MLNYRERRRLSEEMAWRTKIEPPTVKSTRLDWARVKEVAVPALIASVVTLVISPVSQSISYYWSDYLARPLLSVEYVEIIRDAPAFKLPVSEFAQFMRSPDYMFYASSHPNLAHAVGLGLSRGQNASSADLQLVKRALLEVVTDLEGRQARTAEARAATRDETTLDGIRRVVDRYFQDSFNPYATASGGPDDLRRNFLRQVEAEEKRTADFLSTAKVLSSSLDRLHWPIPKWKFKASVLNRGNTDGLVRSSAELITQGASPIALQRIEAPRSNGEAADSLLAVRTVVVNPPEAATREGSVGKVEKRTMADFWFSVRDDSNSQAVLAGLDQIPAFRLVLSDQEGHQFSYALTK